MRYVIASEAKQSVEKYEVIMNYELSSRHVDRSEQSERSGDISRQTQRPQSRQERLSADASTALCSARHDGVFMYEV
jgi:hypothetical protein